MHLPEEITIADRIRLPGRIERTNKATGINSIFGCVLALILFFAGSAFFLIGIRWIPVDPASVNAPYWTISVFGFIFATAGLLLLTNIVQELRHNRKISTLSKTHSDQGAFADYPWDATGITKKPWTAAFNAIFANTLFAVFLLPFNWWAWWAAGSPLVVKIVISVFDLALLLTLYEMTRLILVANKYGHSRLEYGFFPFRTGSEAALKWWPPAGLGMTNRAVFTLRCVEEWVETTGRGKHRRKKIIHEQIWAAVRSAENLNIQPGNPIELSYDIPAGEHGSNLSDNDLVTFWELEVSVDIPGVDFQEQYLVPVYSDEEEDSSLRLPPSAQKRF